MGLHKLIPCLRIMKLIFRISWASRILNVFWVTSRVLNSQFFCFKSAIKSFNRFSLASVLILIYCSVCYFLCYLKLSTHKVKSLSFCKIRRLFVLENLMEKQLACQTRSYSSLRSYQLIYILHLTSFERVLIFEFYLRIHMFD